MNSEITRLSARTLKEVQYTGHLQMVVLSNPTSIIVVQTMEVPYIGQAPMVNCPHVPLLIHMQTLMVVPYIGNPLMVLLPDQDLQTVLQTITVVDSTSAEPIVP